MSMLTKGTKVLESREIRKKLCVTREGTPETNIRSEILKYVGNTKEPQWMDVERDRFETLCHVAADISAAPCTLKMSKSGKMCYSREYDVVLLVGLTELKAQIRWKDSLTGLEKSGDATVVYTSENGHADVGRVRVSTFTPPPRYEDFNPGW